MQALPTHEEVQVVAFDDWVSVEEAARMLDKTGQRVRQMIANKNFATIAELGDRPFYLLVKAEVEALAEWLAEVDKERAQKKAERLAAHK